jgi:hypothetical protein
MIIENFNTETNSWILSSRNIKYSNNILEAELRSCNGNWLYNKIEIHPLLFNKNLINNNGTFKYNLSREDDDNIMSKLFSKYIGPLIPYININKCIILSVNLPKYNKIRERYF